MQMTAKDAEAVKTLAYDWFDIEVDVRPDYSGRGMYGSTTVGFVSGDSHAVAACIGYLAIAEEIDVENFGAGFSIDSMGRSDTILY